MLNLVAELLPIHGKATILLKMLGGAMRKRTKADPKPWYIENIQSCGQNLSYYPTLRSIVRALVLTLALVKSMQGYQINRCIVKFKVLYGKFLSKYVLNLPQKQQIL